MTLYYRSGAAPVRHEWSRDEEIALFKKAKRSAEAREEFISQYLLYAADIGQRAAAGRLRQDDAISAANVGLLKAVDRWKPDGRSRFSTFARKFIRGHVLSEVRRHRVRTMRHVSIDDDESGVPYDSVDHLIAYPEDSVPDLVRETGGKLLKKVMQDILTPRERRVIHLRFGLKWDYTRIGEKEGFRRQRAQQLVARAVAKLRAAYGPKFRKKR
jgi:RNA polymerase sigma factor (sigma-70 family)